MNRAALHHVRQPSRYSCGVACAAMIAGTGITRMLNALPAVRTSERRRKFKRDYVNVGELRRLIQPYGFTVGRRARGLPPESSIAALRIPNHTITGWHWCVWDNGRIHDPMLDGPVQPQAYPLSDSVAWYPISASQRG